jgi:hypothetical protein
MVLEFRKTFLTEKSEVIKAKISKRKAVITAKLLIQKI